MLLSLFLFTILALCVKDIVHSSAIQFHTDPVTNVVKGEVGPPSLAARDIHMKRYLDDTQVTGYLASASFPITQIIETSATASEFESSSDVKTTFVAALSSYLEVLASDIKILTTANVVIGVEPGISIEFSITVDIQDKSTQNLIIAAAVTSASLKLQQPEYLSYIESSLENAPDFPLVTPIQLSTLPSVSDVTVTVVRDIPPVPITYKAAVSIPISQVVITSTTADQFDSSSVALVALDVNIANNLQVEAQNIYVARISDTDVSSQPALKIDYTVNIVVNDLDTQSQVITAKLQLLTLQFQDESYKTAVEAAFTDNGLQGAAVVPTVPSKEEVTIVVEIAPPTLAPTMITENKEYQKEQRDHRATIGGITVAVGCIVSGLYMLYKKKTEDPEQKKEKEVALSSMEESQSAAEKASSRPSRAPSSTKAPLPPMRRPSALALLAQPRGAPRPVVPQAPVPQAPAQPLGGPPRGAGAPARGPLRGTPTPRGTPSPRGAPSPRGTPSPRGAPAPRGSAPPRGAERKPSVYTTNPLKAVNSSS
jgi:hypothetical protein